jgi:hypothetical protein
MNALLMVMERNSAGIPSAAEVYADEQRAGKAAL